MSWALVGLLVQLIGIVIAGWALVTEWRSKPQLQEGSEVRSARKRENPWAQPLETKVPRVSRFDRERYERPRDLGRSRGSHPDTLALG